MEGILWQVLASSRGGPNRARIVALLDHRPRNPNQIAEVLDLDYTTVRHHLDVLENNNIVRSPDSGYGAVYLLTDQTTSHRETLQEIFSSLEVDPESG